MFGGSDQCFGGRCTDQFLQTDDSDLGYLIALCQRYTPSPVVSEADLPAEGYAGWVELTAWRCFAGGYRHLRTSVAGLPKETHEKKKT